MTLHKSYSRDELVQEILEASDVTEQRRLIAAHWKLIDDSAAETLKLSVEDAIHINLQKATQLAELIEYIAELSGNNSFQALAFLAKGNIYNIGMGEYEQSISFYADALNIYQIHKNALGEARVKLGRQWALSWLGRHQESLADAEDCLRILRALQKWRLLTIAMMNLSQVYVYMGNDGKALQWLEQAELVLRTQCAVEKEMLALIQQNRAISLRNIGDFKQSVDASLSAREQLTTLGLKIEAARASQTLGTTYYLLGRYNDAILCFDEAHTIFMEDQRWGNAQSVERYLTDCYLQLRRFDDVIEICGRIRQRFQEQHIEQVVGEILINEASAHAQTGNAESAKQSLSEAMQIFEKLKLPLGIANVKLESANLNQLDHAYTASIQLATAAALQFQKQQNPLKEAESLLVAVESALRGGNRQLVDEWLARVLQICEYIESPFILFQCKKFQGDIKQLEGNLESALNYYESAINELEKLRRSLMLEHRSAFVDNKNDVFEGAAQVCLAMGMPANALEYVERSKSRVLIDLLDQRLSLKIRTQRPTDQVLVDELQELMAVRDRLQSQFAHATVSKLQSLDTIRKITVPKTLSEVEAKITKLWHRLLNINADYARQAALVNSSVHQFDLNVPMETVLIEYFVIGGILGVFCVDSTRRVYHQQLCPWVEVQKLLQRWQLNLQSVTRNPSRNTGQLLPNALGVLGHLHQKLIAPISDYLNGCKIIVVPHRALHYCPFHALYDGKTFLIENFEISYLPSQRLIHLLAQVRLKDFSTMIYGNTNKGNLPFITQEIERIAEILETSAYLDAQISKKTLFEKMEKAHLIHIASHGEFHPDNPIFSGIQLEDGWLTALDVFNLQLNASLVILSGCNTGRNHILGGDEVSGLMQAFLSAGAQSMILSLWPVDDIMSAKMMEQFYAKLKLGETIGGALRSVQINCLHNCDSKNRSQFTQHPFYWAPFFHVGIS